MDPEDDTDPEDPQSWNKYAYVRNNPLNTVDPKGTQGVGIPTSQQQVQQLTAMAQMQQATKQGQAMQAAAQAAAFEQGVDAAVDGVCSVAPTVAEVSGGLTLAAMATAPLTEGATLPAAGALGRVTMAADGVALACDPMNPEAAASFAADLSGMKAAHSMSKLVRDVPEVVAGVKAALIGATGAAVEAGTKPVAKHAAGLCP